MIITDHPRAFDRYTIYTKPSPTGNTYLECYSMSYNPLGPRGYNQFAGALPAPNDRAQRVTLEELPEQVQKAINYRLGEKE